MKGSEPIDVFILALIVLGAAVVAIGVLRDDRRVRLWRREALYDRVARSPGYPAAYETATAILESGASRMKRKYLIAAVLRRTRDDGRPVKPIVAAAAVDDVLDGREPRRPQ